VIPAPNKYRLPVHEMPEPQQWTSRQAKFLWQLIRDGSPIVDLHVGRASIEIDPPSFRLSRHANADVRGRLFASYLEEVKKWVENQAALVRAYGPPEAVSEPLHAPGGLPNEDRQEYLCRIMQGLKVTGWVITAAGGTRVETDASGAYREAPREGSRDVL
jgi:hypothetical protein